MIDADRLRADWARLTESPGLDRFAATFYAWLFAVNPEARARFPSGMSRQRLHLVEAIGAVVANVDRLDAVAGVLERLGRDHRRYGAQLEHYDAVGAALGQSLGQHGPVDLENWREAFQTVAAAMIEAALRAEAAGAPGWLDLVPIEHSVIHEGMGEVVHLVVDLPPGLPPEWQPGDLSRFPVSAEGAPGMWVEARVYDHEPAGPGVWLSHHVDPTDPGSLALLYLPDGAPVRFGEPLPPAREDV